MNYLYLSSGLFGAKVLASLTPRPSLVITQPDRLGGRGMKTLLSTPVKALCQELQIPFRESLQTNLSQFDLALVADYGKILPETVLKQTRHGFWNLHPSLLPKYRGPTPLQNTLLDNEKITGVSIIKLDELVDHGPILAQQEVTLDINDNYLTLLEKTAKLGAEMFNKLIANPIDSLELKTQDHTQATFTKKIKKEHGFVSLEQLTPYLEPLFRKYNLTHLFTPRSLGEVGPTKTIDPLRLHNLIRAYYPWPCVWTNPGDKVIKLTKSIWDQELTIQEVVIEGKSYGL